MSYSHCQPSHLHTGFIDCSHSGLTVECEFTCRPRLEKSVNKAVNVLKSHVTTSERVCLRGDFQMENVSNSVLLMLIRLGCVKKNVDRMWSDANLSTFSWPLRRILNIQYIGLTWRTTTGKIATPSDRSAVVSDKKRRENEDIFCYLLTFMSSKSRMLPHKSKECFWRICTHIFSQQR